MILNIHLSKNTFFFSEGAKELWKSVTSVSNQGRMRGRAKGMLRIKDLHRGQKLGMGKNRMRFPGLTSAISSKEGMSSLKMEQVRFFFEKLKLVLLQNCG